MTLNVFAVVRMQRATGTPRDVVENTFAFSAMSGTPLDLADIADKVGSFYTATPDGGTNAVSRYINDTVSRDVPAEIILYDLEPVLAGPSGVMGPPIHVETFTLDDPLVGNPMPDEVAVCLSIHSVLGTEAEHGVGTRPRARHRGRVFIGPLVNNGSVIDIVGPYAHVANTIQTDLGQSAIALENISLAGVSQWSVWSRKNNLLTPIEGGWVDNAFDTQRRRGIEATSRRLWGGRA